MNQHKGLFDRWAATVSEHVAKAWFFCLCVLLVVLWVPTLFFLPIDTSQLIINTLTTIITFLLVALLQNDQQQFEDKMTNKLDAQSKALAEFIEHADLWFTNTNDGSNALNNKTHNMTFKYAQGIANKLRESIG